MPSGAWARCLQRRREAHSLSRSIRRKVTQGHGQVERHIGHVNLRVADQEVSKRFYRDLLGFVIAEEDPEHGGVFTTLGDNFHTVDIGQHPAPKTARRPERGQIGRGHISFQVGSYAASRDAYAHLVGSGVEILRATVQVLFRRSRRQHARDLLRVAARAGAVPRRASRPGRGSAGQPTRRPVAQLAARRLAAAGDAGEDREPAARLGLSI